MLSSDERHKIKEIEKAIFSLCPAKYSRLLPGHSLFMTKRELNKSKHNPTKLLKVPYGAYKKANEDGLLKEFLFYYTLKSINTEGVLLRGKSIEQIQSKTPYSKSHIRLLLSRCEKLGFIARSKGNIQICSYDKFWKIIGIDTTGQIKLIKIVPDIESFKGDLYIGEIKRNLRKQKAEVTRCKKADTDLSDNIIRKKVNRDITLSCEGVANLFGFKSASQGHKIERELMLNGLITIERRLRIIQIGVNEESVRSLYLDSKFFYANGCLIQQLPNKLIPIIL